MTERERGDQKKHPRRALGSLQPNCGEELRKRARNNAENSVDDTECVSLTVPVTERRLDLFTSERRTSRFHPYRSGSAISRPRPEPDAEELVPLVIGLNRSSSTYRPRREGTPRRRGERNRPTTPSVPRKKNRSRTIARSVSFCTSSSASSSANDRIDGYGVSLTTASFGVNRTQDLVDELNISSTSSWGSSRDNERTDFHPLSRPASPMPAQPPLGDRSPPLRTSPRSPGTPIIQGSPDCRVSAESPQSSRTLFCPDLPLSPAVHLSTLCLASSPRLPPTSSSSYSTTISGSHLSIPISPSPIPFSPPTKPRPGTTGFTPSSHSRSQDRNTFLAPPSAPRRVLNQNVHLGKGGLAVQLIPIFSCPSLLTSLSGSVPATSSYSTSTSCSTSSSTQTISAFMSSLSLPALPPSPESPPSNKFVDLPTTPSASSPRRPSLPSSPIPLPDDDDDILPVQSFSTNNQRCVFIGAEQPRGNALALCTTATRTTVTMTTTSAIGFESKYEVEPDAQHGSSIITQLVPSESFLSPLIASSRSLHLAPPALCLSSSASLSSSSSSLSSSSSSSTSLPPQPFSSPSLPFSSPTFSSSLMGPPRMSPIGHRIGATRYSSTATNTTSSPLAFRSSNTAYCVKISGTTTKQQQQQQDKGKSNNYRAMDKENTHPQQAAYTYRHSLSLPNSNNYHPGFGLGLSGAVNVASPASVLATPPRGKAGFTAELRNALVSSPMEVGVSSPWHGPVDDEAPQFPSHTKDCSSQSRRYSEDGGNDDVEGPQNSRFNTVDIAQQPQLQLRPFRGTSRDLKFESL